MPFQTSFEFRSPTRLIHGAGCIRRLPNLLPGKKPVLLVTDKGLVLAGVVDEVAQILDRAGIPHAVFDGALPNPPARCVNAALRLYTRERCARILAVGGGSPMDTAKMGGILATNGGRIEQYLGAGKVRVDLPPLVCVATTYGTGSEVTPFAVLTNPKTKTKDPIVSWRIVPQAGLLDPELCVSLPAAVGAPTGMDALTHALESYTNLMATPATDAMAIAAIQMIGENIRTACANDFELEATESMLLASSMAGIAFSQTRLGIVHAMSHPVGGHFNVHHGTANAILLPHVMEFNLPARVEKFADIGEALTGDARNGDREAAEMAVEAVIDLNRDLEIPDALSDVGVQSRAIPAMSKDAMASPNTDINPRKASLDDITSIFKASL